MTVQIGSTPTPDPKSYRPLTYYWTAHSGAGRQWSLLPAAVTPVYPIFICSPNLEQIRVDRKSLPLAAFQQLNAQYSNLYRSVVQIHLTALRYVQYSV